MGGRCVLGGRCLLGKRCRLSCQCKQPRINGYRQMDTWLGKLSDSIDLLGGESNSAHHERSIDLMDIPGSSSEVAGVALECCLW